MDDELAKLQQRYLSAMHAVQSGIAQKMTIDPSDTAPKHLRTGIDSALVSSSALARIMIESGVISEIAWRTMLATVAEEEKASYEADLSRLMGVTIKLG